MYINENSLLYITFLDNDHKELSNKREMRMSDLTVKFANKSFGQRLSVLWSIRVQLFSILCLGNFKKKILGGEIANNQGLIYKYLFLELDNDLR